MITKTAKNGSQIETVSLDNGRHSIDPVTLIKILIIQYMFGIKSITNYR